MATAIDMLPGARREANSTALPTRRHILASAAIGSVSPAASSPATTVPLVGADDALLVACASFEAACAARGRLQAMPYLSDEAIETAVEYYFNTRDQVIDAGAPSTLAGRIALARAARLGLDDLLKNDRRYPEHALIEAALAAAEVA